MTDPVFPSLIKYSNPAQDQSLELSGKYQTAACHRLDFEIGSRFCQDEGYSSTSKVDTKRSRSSRNETYQVAFLGDVSEPVNFLKVLML